MSRNRNRGQRSESTVPAIEAATPVAGAQQPRNDHNRGRKVPEFQFSRPVVVDTSKADIDDFVLIAELSTMGKQGLSDQEATQIILSRVREVRDLLSRVVKGGTQGRPAAEFFPLVVKVVNEFGNQGN